MSHPSSNKHGVNKALAFSAWLYSLLLHVYPTTFRRAYSSRMTRVFRDSCKDAVQQHGITALAPLWLHALSDLLLSACLERWSALKEKIHTMTLHTHSQNFSLRFWVALSTTLFTFVVSLVASLNLYLLEDTSPLTQAAYIASPWLRFSYDGIYLSALAAGVAVCAIVGYALVPRAIPVSASLILVALLVAFGGFGGLLVRHSATFFVFCAVFFALTLLSLLIGRVVATRVGQHLGRRPAGVLGACVSVSSILLVNVVTLVLHTLILNPVSHTLYMQGQIGKTSWNFSLIVMGIALLALLTCTVSLGRALRFPLSQS